MTNGDQNIAAAARAFLTAAWGELERLHVVPRPWFAPYVRVGRDYIGHDVTGPESSALEEAIQAAYPRFRDDDLRMPAFPSSYIYSFLETFVVRLATQQEEFSATGPAARQTIRDLARALKTTEPEVSCCRLVSHLTTTTGEPLTAAGVTIHPAAVPPHDHRGRIRDVINKAIPGASAAYAHDAPMPYLPPDSVVVTCSVGADPFVLGAELSNRIDWFLLVTRLLQGGTGSSVFEVRGESNPVRNFTPTLVPFRGAIDITSDVQLVRRVTRIAPADRRRINGLSDLLQQVWQIKPDMFTTSFSMAVHKFVSSYHAYAWYEQIVDLATAMEAALSGTEKEDVTLRLKSRAAALLHARNDPAPVIFTDVGTLYTLRSNLVHGNEVTTKSLMKDVRKLSTVPVDAPDGVAVAHAVDRFRNLVRRSILARIGLAAADAPLWPLGGTANIDGQLVDDATRAQWHSSWRARLRTIGALSAADRVAVAVDVLSQDDR